MRVAERMPALAFPDEGAMRRASRGEELLGLGGEGEGEGGMWEGEREGLWRGFEELMGLVGAGR